MKTKVIKNQSEARDLAIEWQKEQSKRNISYKELAKWQIYFTTLAMKFNLKEEFKENGII